MSRELEAGADSALQGRHVSEVVFLEFDFLSGVSRACTREHSVDWNAQTWLGAGRIGIIEPITEGGELEARGIAMTVSALPAGLLALALTPSEYKGREVRLWFGQMTEERYLALPGSTVNYASTPDSAILDQLVGDMDARVRIAMADWTPAAIAYYLNKYTSAANGTFLMNIGGSGLGRIGFEWVEGSTLRSVASDAAPAVSDGNTLWLRATIDVDNGAGGHAVHFYTSTDYSPRTGSGSWAQLGSTRNAGAFTTSVAPSTARLIIGGFNSGAGASPNSKVYYAEIRNGIDGPVVAQFDASLMDPMQTSAQMPNGEVWTLNQSGSPAARIVRDPLAVVADPVGPFIFRMDQLTWQLGGEFASLRVTAESRLADWHRPRVRRYNNPDHQALHPGDKFFEHVERQVEAVHRW